MARRPGNRGKQVYWLTDFCHSSQWKTSRQSYKTESSHPPFSLSLPPSAAMVMEGGSGGLGAPVASTWVLIAMSAGSMATGGKQSGSRTHQWLPGQRPEGPRWLWLELESRPHQPRPRHDKDLVSRLRPDQEIWTKASLQSCNANFDGKCWTFSECWEYLWPP